MLFLDVTTFLIQMVKNKKIENVRLLPSIKCKYILDDYKNRQAKRPYDQ